MISTQPSPYRDHARLSRELARCLTDSETKAHLFDMAQLYDRLADSVERDLVLAARAA